VVRSLGFLGFVVAGPGSLAAVPLAELSVRANAVLRLSNSHPNCLGGPTPTLNFWGLHPLSGYLQNRSGRIQGIGASVAEAVTVHADHAVIAASDVERRLYLSCGVSSSMAGSSRANFNEFAVFLPYCSFITRWLITVKSGDLWLAKLA
jgi:hypothetical protein